MFQDRPDRLFSFLDCETELGLGSQSDKAGNLLVPPAERYISNHAEKIGEEFQELLADAIGEGKSEVDDDDDDDDDEDEEDPKKSKKKDKAEDDKKEQLEDTDVEDGEKDPDKDEKPVGESFKLSKRKIKNSDKAFFAGTYGNTKIEKIFDHEYFIIGESLEDEHRFYPCQLKDGKIERVLGDEALLTLADAKDRFYDFIGESKEDDSIIANPAIVDDEIPDEIGEASAEAGTVSDCVPVFSSPGKSVKPDDDEEEDDDEETEI